MGKRYNGRNRFLKQNIKEEKMVPWGIFTRVGKESKNVKKVLIHGIKKVDEERLRKLDEIALKKYP